jgi:hypothetical protein
MGDMKPLKTDIRKVSATIFLNFGSLNFSKYLFLKTLKTKPRGSHTHVGLAKSMMTPGQHDKAIHRLEVMSRIAQVS